MGLEHFKIYKGKYHLRKMERISLKKDIKRSFSKLLKAMSAHKSIVLVAVNKKSNIVGMGELNSNAWP